MFSFTRALYAYGQKLAADFNAAAHPRYPKGTPLGGQFVGGGPKPDRADKEAHREYMANLVKQNNALGASRMESINKKLLETYPPGSGAQIHRECYLCDNMGRRLKDPRTGQARRIDFLVVQGGKAIRSIEVTSSKAQKSTQMGKENRIRNNYQATGKVLYAQIKGGDVVRMPYSLKTRVWRTEDYAA